MNDATEALARALHAIALDPRTNFLSVESRAPFEQSSPSVYREDAAVLFAALRDLGYEIRPTT